MPGWPPLEYRTVLSGDVQADRVSAQLSDGVLTQTSGDHGISASQAGPTSPSAALASAHAVVDIRELL